MVDGDRALPEVADRLGAGAEQPVLGVLLVARPWLLRTVSTTGRSMRRAVSRAEQRDRVGPARGRREGVAVGLVAAQVLHDRDHRDRCLEGLGEPGDEQRPRQEALTEHDLDAVARERPGEAMGDGGVAGHGASGARDSIGKGARRVSGSFRPASDAARRSSDRNHTGVHARPLAATGSPAA